MQVQWTDELVAQCTQLRNAGYSYGKIGHELKISKDAVLNKLKRAGVRGGSIQIRPPIRIENPPTVQINAPEPLRVPFMKAGPFHCRSVVDGECGLDGRAIFCGLPTKEGSSYCPYHHTRNWVRPRR